MKKISIVLVSFMLTFAMADAQNLLINGDFEGETLDPWWVFVDAGNAAATVDSSAGSVNYTEITNPGVNTYDIQLIQELSEDQIMELEDNLNGYYDLSFTAIVPEARNCNLFFGEIGGSWTNLAGGKVFNFTPSQTEYTHVIHVTATFDAMKFGLEIGTSDVPVEFDDIVLELQVPDDLESEQAGTKFQVYPNPVRDVLRVEGDQGCTVSLYTATGILLQTGAMAADRQLEFDMSDLTAGIYLLRIRSSDESIEKRILVW